MSKEAALEFMKMLDSDEALKKQLSSSESLEDIIKAAKEKGIEFSVEDWIAATQSMFESGDSA
jgi:predicted ribosomally synthesized peptide with nif11-like leader